MQTYWLQPVKPNQKAAHYNTSAKNCRFVPKTCNIGPFSTVVVSCNRNNGNAGETSGNWCLGPSTGDASAEVWRYHPLKKFEIVYAKSCNFVNFIRKMVCNAVHNAFLNILTIGTQFPRVQAAFQHMESTFPRVPLEMTAILQLTL